MAAFANYYASDTTTSFSNGGYYSGTLPATFVPQHLYVQFFIPAPEQAASKPLLARERDRIALRAAGRSLPFPPLSSPSTGLTGAYTAAPRRTVVPRGRVSWVRAGTRRPL